MPASHFFRDPDLLTNRPISEESLTLEVWSSQQLIAMDDAFTAAMLRAGHVLTSPSSRPGTRSPVQGYRREDG